jgi:hypothetical protein
MSLPNLTPLLERTDVLIGCLVLTVLLMWWVGSRVRRIAKSERPDDALSNVAMLIGFGWSSEAVWLVTGPGGADLLTPIRIALFAVFEVILIVFMIRSKRNMRILGRPGRAGRIAWLVATGMSLVAVWTAHNAGEAFLRLLVPILLTAMWWDGLVGEGVKRREDATTIRWTPRRALLALGAIEPGERDVETVHRERLTQQMTQLEFRRRHGGEWRKKWAARRLARLSLTADDEMISEVRQRVDRASWFEPTQDQPAEIASRQSITVGAAASARARRVRHGKALRKVHVTHPRPVIVAAQEPEPDPRATHEIDDAIRVIKSADPALSQRKIAHLLRTSDARVARALRRRQNPEPPPPVNGRKPELTGADR